jgi:hypothetical protein
MPPMIFKRCSQIAVLATLALLCGSVDDLARGADPGALRSRGARRLACRSCLGPLVPPHGVYDAILDGDAAHPYVARVGPSDEGPFHFSVSFDFFEGLNVDAIAAQAGQWLLEGFYYAFPVHDFPVGVASVFRTRSGDATIDADFTTHRLELARPATGVPRSYSGRYDVVLTADSHGASALFGAIALRLVVQESGDASADGATLLDAAGEAAGVVEPGSCTVSPGGAVRCGFAFEPQGGGPEQSFLLRGWLGAAPRGEFALGEIHLPVIDAVFGEWTATRARRGADR